MQGSDGDEQQHWPRHVDMEAEFRRDVGLQSAQGPRGVVTLLFTAQGAPA